jgi:hypothetical protein
MRGPFTYFLFNQHLLQFFDLTSLSLPQNNKIDTCSEQWKQIMLSIYFPQYQVRKKPHFLLRDCFLLVFESGSIIHCFHCSESSQQLLIHSKVSVSQNFLWELFTAPQSTILSWKGEEIKKFHHSNTPYSKLNKVQANLRVVFC